MRGKLITIEGPEGVGKSTQVSYLREYAQEHYLNVLFLREPGCTYTGERIRDVLLKSKNEQINANWSGGDVSLDVDAEMSPMCEAYLYAACRVELIEKVIKPTLEQGISVICDRYIDSSIAYQGYGRELGVERVESINAYAMDNCYPDYTIFLNLPPEKAFIRKGGVDKNDRLELAGAAFHERVYKGFVQERDKHSSRYIDIIPDGDKLDTHRKIVAELLRLMPNIFHKKA